MRALPGCAEAVPLERRGAGMSGVAWCGKRAIDATTRGEASADTAPAVERTLLVLARGNLRKQGTITRRGSAQATPGARYHKQADVGRHSLLRVLTNDVDELGTLRDFASISHPVLGDAAHGDAASNHFLDHRHGLDRAFVHCAASRLRVGTQLHQASSELAPDLARVLVSLGSDQGAL